MRGVVGRQGKIRGIALYVIPDLIQNLVLYVATTIDVGYIRDPETSSGSYPLSLLLLSFKKYVSMNELRGANRRFLSLRRNALCDCGNPRFYPIHYCLPPFLFRLRRDCHSKRRSQRRNGEKKACRSHQNMGGED